MPARFSSVGISKVLLKQLAELRLQEFQSLRAASHHVGALYLAGYAVEALLKCAICKTLDTTELPVNFQLHDLDDLLFLAGLARKIQAYKPVSVNFQKFKEIWESGKLRYSDPARTEIHASYLRRCRQVVK